MQPIVDMQSIVHMQPNSCLMQPNIYSCRFTYSKPSIYSYTLLHGK